MCVLDVRECTKTACAALRNTLLLPRTYEKIKEKFALYASYNYDKLLNAESKLDDEKKNVVTSICATQAENA